MCDLNIQMSNLAQNDVPCLYQSHLNMSHMVRKLDFCQCENKDTDQMCRNCTADQRLGFFRFTDSSITFLPKSDPGRFRIDSIQSKLWTVFH